MANRLIFPKWLDPIGCVYEPKGGAVCWVLEVDEFGPLVYSMETCELSVMGAADCKEWLLLPDPPGVCFVDVGAPILRQLFKTEA